MITVLVRKSKLKLILFLSILCFLICCAFLFCAEFKAVKTNKQAEPNLYNFNADDNAQRVEFLSQFGWQVDETPIDIRNITIPEKFNDTYQNYNTLQKSQGLDLYKYAGKNCKIYTYKINNHPSLKGNINANLIVLNGKLIAGDICSTSLNGFMHGFDKINDQINSNL